MMTHGPVVHVNTASRQWLGAPGYDPAEGRAEDQAGWDGREDPADRLGGKMSKQRIRPLAICVFSHDGKILATESVDSVKGETFYRPLGGRIEFGETAVETLHRELMEEIQAEIKDLRYLTTLENIFTYEGERGHEIVMVFDGKLSTRISTTPIHSADRHGQ
jgi:ADP-ribose pyrophosphatase YjhB (NUDIX family)